MHCIFILKDDSRANPIWSAIFHSISSFCTAGFSLYANSFENYANNFWLNFTVTVLSMLGAIGYIVIIDIWLMLKGTKKEITFTSKIILYVTFWLLAGGTFLIFITEKSIQMLEPWERLHASFFQAMTALTTVGYNTINIGGLSLSTLFLIIIFMIIGASPSGTGGGVKSTTISAIIGLLKALFRKDKDIKFMDKIIPLERVIFAVCSFIFYILILITGVYLLSLTEKQEFLSIFFETASALGTVGLSAGITNALTPLGKVIIILLMFIGRLGPISFGMTLFYKFENDKKIDEPEDLIV